MNDEILLLQLKRGNQFAFTSIYNKYAREAYVLAFKYLGSKELAEDAVQNLFLKIWNIREEIDETRPFNYFLFTILRNNLLNVLRDSKKDCFVLDDCLEVLNVIDNADAEIDSLEQEKIVVLKKAIEMLSPQRKKILTMKISGKYSNQEIAEKLNLSVNTIKFQYTQALKQIKTYSRNYSIEMLLAFSIVEMMVS